MPAPWGMVGDWVRPVRSPWVYHLVEHFMLKALIGLDHGIGHLRPLGLTRHCPLLAYHYMAISHEGLRQVF